MNIFVLDSDPAAAARYHCDKHVVKMILETGQLLCTAHWVHWLRELGKSRSDFRLVRDMIQFLQAKVSEEKRPPWKLTHMNHPCAVWCRENTANYYWTLRLMRSLLDQYTLRYEKKHKSELVYKWLDENVPPGIEEARLSSHPICMPDECKVEGSVVDSYRKYYIEKKSYMAKWRAGNKPSWWPY